LRATGRTPSAGPGRDRFGVRALASRFIPAGTGAVVGPRSNSKITCPNRTGPRPNPLCPPRSTGLARNRPPVHISRGGDAVENRKPQSSPLCVFFKKNIAEAERLNTVPVGVFLLCLTFENEWAKPILSVSPSPHASERDSTRRCTGTADRYSSPPPSGCFPETRER